MFLPEHTVQSEEREQRDETLRLSNTSVSASSIEGASLFGSCRPPAISGHRERLSQEEKDVTQEWLKSFFEGSCRPSHEILHCTIFSSQCSRRRGKCNVLPFNVPSKGFSFDWKASCGLRPANGHRYAEKILKSGWHFVLECSRNQNEPVGSP